MARRVAEHNGEGGSKKGAKYTRPRRPVTLAWSAPFETRAAALKAEAAMKKLPRAKKLEIISGAAPSPAISPVSRERNLKKSKPASTKAPKKNRKVIPSAAHRPSKAKIR